MKKVLALVLALVMVLGTFGTAFAAYDDVAGTATESAVDRLSLLGILEGYPDGTFRPEGQITRAEFAAVAVRAKGLENVAKAAQGLSTGFTDVAATSWASGYVGTAQRLSIVNGVGNGLFAPNAPVKYEEAVTMIVRALGYEAAAQAKGGYPYGYLIVANEVGLLDAVKGTQGVPATRGLVAQLTDNALETAMMIQVGFGSDTKWVVSGTEGTKEVNLLDNMGFDVYEDVLEVVSTSKGTIKLEGKTLNVGKDFDFEFYEALTVKAWAKDKDVVVYAAQNEAMYDATTVDKAKVKLVGENKSYDLVKGLEAEKADYAKVILNDDGEVEFIKYYNFEGFIVVEEVDGTEVVSYDDFDELDLEDFVVVREGKTIEVADIVEGDIVFFNTEEEFAVVYNNSVEGEIERVYTDAFRLGGKSYDLALGALFLDDEEIGTISNTSDNELVAMMEEETTVEAFLNYEGDVVLVVGTRGEVKTSTFTGILVEAAQTYTTRNRQYLPLDLINADGDKVSFDANEDVLEESGYTFAEFNTPSTAIKANTVIEYKVDEDGDLVEFTKLTKVKKDVVATVKVDARYVDGYRLKSNTVVFLLDSESKVDEVFAWSDAKDYFGEMTKFDVYHNDADATHLVVINSDAGDEFEAEAGVLISAKALRNGKYETTINIDGTNYKFDLATNYAQSGDTVDAVYKLKGQLVKFNVNEELDEIQGTLVAETTKLASGVIGSISSRNKTFTVAGTAYTLVSDAVVIDATVATPKVISLTDVKDGETVTAYFDGSSTKYIKYLVVTGDVVANPSNPVNEQVGTLLAAYRLNDKVYVQVVELVGTTTTKVVKTYEYIGVQAVADLAGYVNTVVDVTTVVVSGTTYAQVVVPPTTNN